MDKPITVTMEEYQGALVSLTNNAPLPTFIKVQIVKELLTALSDLDIKEREKAKQEWVESQKEPPEAPDAEGGEDDDRH